MTNIREKAQELFKIMSQTTKTLSKIPLSCSQGEIRILLYLSLKENGSTASKVSKELGMSLTRITAVFNSLEEKKLIKKNIDENDKRKTIISITKEGKRVIEEKQEEAITNMVTILEKLSEEEVNQYLNIVRKIQRIITEMQEEKS